MRPFLYEYSLRELRAKLGVRLGLAKWLFIHIPKNAGVSIAKHRELYWRMARVEAPFLPSRAYLRELLQVMDAAGEHHGIQHARWRDAHPDVRRKLQPVAVVRNPWARSVSRYRFARPAIENGKAAPGYVPNSFEALLEERHQYGNRPFYWHRAIRGWYPQADYVTDETGRIVAELLRQENLEEEAARYFGLKTPLRRRNVSTSGQGRSYADYYTAKTIQIVADWYEKDIELFGFDFDTPARRNCFFGAD